MPGHPQTLSTWRHVAPPPAERHRLARNFPEAPDFFVAHHIQGRPKMPGSPRGAATPSREAPAAVLDASTRLLG